VEFEPAARVQYSASPRRRSEHQVYLLDPVQPYAYQREEIRYRGPSDIRFRPVVRRKSSGALVAGALSIIFGLLFGFLGFAFAFVAIHYGRKDKAQGLEGADLAVKLGVIGILLSLVDIVVMIIIAFL
jgi:hypothetical protein